MLFALYRVKLITMSSLDVLGKSRTHQRNLTLKLAIWNMLDSVIHVYALSSVLTAYHIPHTRVIQLRKGRYLQ